MTKHKKTALHQVHVDLGAKMISFAGYDMPVRYSSVIEEHHAVRQSVGVFDVSHMGEILITGPQALHLVQRVSSNDASSLSIGQAQYSYMPNNQGGIIDDMIIYRLSEDHYLLVVNASNIQKDWDWIAAANIFGSKMDNVSDQYQLLAVQGPRATDLLQSLTDVTLKEIAYYNFRQSTIAGIDNVIISATGYTGSGGYELYVPTEHTMVLWDAIFTVDSNIKVLPAGLGARDTLRLEMGYCLYGQDIDDTTSPIAAGLSWVTKFNHDFIHASQLEKQKLDKPPTRLAGFIMNDKGIPRQGYDILDHEGIKIGLVTSGTMSPTLKKGIGLGYIDVPHHKKGTQVFVQIRNKRMPATITKPPFIEQA